jgi:predicted membrane chloride channel (bestrophin family)
MKGSYFLGLVLEESWKHKALLAYCINCLAFPIELKYLEMEEQIVKNYCISSSFKLVSKVHFALAFVRTL